MKRFLLLTFLATASAHAIWPFSPPEDEQTKQARLEARAAKQKAQLEAKQAKIHADYVKMRRTDPQYAAIVRYEDACIAQAAKEKAITDAQHQKEIEHEADLQKIRDKMFSDLEDRRKKTEEERIFCLSHYRTASTSEEIATSIPHFSWFALKFLSDEEFLKSKGMTREQYDIDFKKRVEGMSQEDRIKEIEYVFSIDSKIESNPIAQASRARAEYYGDKADQGFRQTAMLKAAEEANQIARDANAQARANAAVQDFNQSINSMQQHIDQESIKSSIDSLGNTSHSGTIYYDNGHKATYQGN